MTPFRVERLVELRRHLGSPGFRNVLIHEYVAFDMDRVLEALDRLQPVEEFLEIVRRDVTG